MSRTSQPPIPASSRARWHDAEMTMERLRSLRDRRLRGMSTRHLAAEVGVAANCLRRWWRRYLGWRPTHPHHAGEPTVWDRASLVESRHRYLSGATVHEVAADYGCTVSALRGAWKTYGITTEMPRPRPTEADFRAAAAQLDRGVLASFVAEEIGCSVSNLWTRTRRYRQRDGRRIPRTAAPPRRPSSSALPVRP